MKSRLFYTVKGIEGTAYALVSISYVNEQPLGLVIVYCPMGNEHGKSV